MTPRSAMVTGVCVEYLLGFARAGAMEAPRGRGREVLDSVAQHGGLQPGPGRKARLAAVPGELPQVRHRGRDREALVCLVEVVGHRKVHEIALDRHQAG